MNAPRPVSSDPFNDQTPNSVEPVHSRSRSLDRSDIINRSYEVSWLSDAGKVHFDTVTAAAHPVIEATCANLARGAVIATAEGPVAVEDLQPGAKIMTSEYGPVTLQWVGSYTMTGCDLQDQKRSGLMRVMADTFGLSKPDADLILSPRAHILMRHPACKALTGLDVAYAPIRAFEDGVQVVGLTPLSPVTMFNLAFDRQATITANGIEVESFHPGPVQASLADSELKFALLRLFPHVRTLSDFGSQLTQRLTTYEVQQLREGS